MTDWAVLHPYHDAVITGPDGLSLYIVDRPLKRHEFIVVALIPDGVRDTQVHGYSPGGITVPRDPVRAAAAVERCLLPRYRSAAAQVRCRARLCRPHSARVSFTWDQNLAPAVEAHHPQAADILKANGFRFDHQAQGYRLPHSLRGRTSAGRVQQPTKQLDGAVGAGLTSDAAGAAEAVLRHDRHHRSRCQHWSTSSHAGQS